MTRRLLEFVLGITLVACLARPATAVTYPPGPGGTCPDTLTLFQVENTLEPCHPVAGDTVSGVRGVIIGFDTKPSAYAFYIQSTFADGPHGWTGLQVFTGAYNYNAAVAGTPTGGNLALGDSVVIYGSMLEFNSETEIQGPDALQGTNDILIRKIANVALPAAKLGTTVTYNWNPAISASTAEPWEGCLVRVEAPLRVARTATGLGVSINTFLVVNPNSPGDSLLVDGSSLTTLGAPPLGADLDFVQGILSQKTIGGVSSYRIMVRGPNDYSIIAAPNPIDAYAIGPAKLRLVFDKNLDLATAQSTSSYTVDHHGVSTATLVGGAGAIVELDLATTFTAGLIDTVRTSGIGSAACTGCLSSPKSLGFVDGIVSVAAIQAPDVSHLPPTCEDRSRFAGAGTAAGTRLTVRGTAVQSYGSLYYITDAGGGPRAGLTVFAPPTPLTSGHQYRISGSIQEFQGETEVSFVVDVVDEGVATVPPPSDQSFTAMADTTCDAAQNITNSEDYEGGLVRLSNVRVVPFNTAPTNPVAGASFRIVRDSPVSADTILVSNNGNHYTFDPEPGMVLGIASILHVSPGVRLLPRANTDIMLLSQIQPASGGNQGSVSATISGFGFQAGATARLRRSGQPSIVGTSPIASSDSRSLTATFDLAGAVAGAWDVIVDFPETFSDTMAAAFTIESTEAPQLRIMLLGPQLIRSNTRTAFDLVIDNPGNVDARNVPVWVTGIPAAATAEFDFTLGYPPPSGGEPDWAQSPLTLPRPPHQYLTIVIPRVPPGATTRRLLLTVPDTIPLFELQAALTPGWNSGSVFKSCLVDGGVIGDAACMGTQIDAIAAFLAANPAIPALSGVAAWAKIAWQCEGAASLPAAVAEAKQALDFMLQPIVQSGSPPASCATSLPPQWLDTLAVGVVTSIDPNDKLGPHGPLSVQQAIPYSIRFENLASATAPAQRVVITDPIPISTLNPATISLGPITFGTTTIIPPPGLSIFGTRYNLPSRNVIVDISVGVDPISHALSWSFTSLDPATGQPVTNPLAGFLPPNHVSPEGEGSVLFTIMPQSSLGSGTTISNSASIKFDNNAPIATPTWSNVVDITAPESHVNPLAAHSDLPSVPVAWTADNSPTDLRDYTVYVSEDGQPFRVWRLNTAVSSDTLMPPGDHHLHSYAFISVARDLAGNIEAMPPGADATTQSRTAVETAAGPTLALEGASPNPARGVIGVSFTLPSRSPATLDVIDVAGRRVLRREVGVLGPGPHHLALAGTSPFRPGLYFLRLSQAGETRSTRVAVIR